MGNNYHRFDNYGLHKAALEGDDRGVALAINQGADVNILDSVGRTALMCSVAGERWKEIDAPDASFLTRKRLNVIHMLLQHPDVNLCTMNAPISSMNGVVPLGMAAWLNLPEVVEMLLSNSSDAVSVDGMDSQGATALMYAARDGSLSVAQLLLSHGARPDFRDLNQRTSIQFALQHPQILWLCELVLRRHRWRESQAPDRNKLYPSSDTLLDLARSSMPSDSLEPPALSNFANQAMFRLTDTLISSITTCDLPFLYSLLFSPPLPSSAPSEFYPMSAPLLVNRPDARGWSPIHYCVSVSMPSIEILDALYCAGAEVALFTAEEQFTVLHILAQSVRLPAGDEEVICTLYQFAVHLIRDLRAPLAARDKNDETCIHIAAEHGNSVELLMLLLDFDSAGTIREMRNARGLSALEVCKPEFRLAFGQDTENLRSVSSLSCQTIRPIHSFSSLVSLSEWRSSTIIYEDDEASLYSASDPDIEALTQKLLDFFRANSISACVPFDGQSISRLSDSIKEANKAHAALVKQLQQRVDEANLELDDLRAHADKAEALLDSVTTAAVHRLGGSGFDACKRRNRASEDSQTTMLNRSGSTSMTSIANSGHMDETHVSVATQTQTASLKTFPDRSASWTDWFEGLLGTASGSSYSSQLEKLAEVEHELALHKRRMMEQDADWNIFASPDLEAKLQQLLNKQKKLRSKIQDLEAFERKRSDKSLTLSRGGLKLKSWFKKFVQIPEKMATKIQIVYALDDDCAVGRQVKEPMEGGVDTEVEGNILADSRIEGALRTSNVVLNLSHRDLRSIYNSLDTAEQFLDLAVHSIARAERVGKRAIKARETMLENLLNPSASPSLSNLHLQPPRTPGLLGYNLSSHSSSVTSLSSMYSSRSSIAPAITENADGDARTFRRIVLRKFDASVAGSWDEMEKTKEWLCIVKEAVRGVKRRAYL